MTEQTELRIPYNDLKYVAVVCSCGTEITIDVSPKPKNQEQTDWTAKALKCTFCALPFDSNFKAALANLAHWQMLVKDSGMGDRVFFRVKKT